MHPLDPYSLLAMHYREHRDLVACPPRRRVRRLYWLTRRFIRLGKVRIARRIAAVRAVVPVLSSTAS